MGIFDFFFLFCFCSFGLAEYVKTRMKEMCYELGLYVAAENAMI